MIAMLLALAAAQTSPTLPTARALPPPAREEQAVLDSVNALLTAFATGDASEILRRVYPDGRVTGVGTFPSRSGMLAESWTEFTQRIGTSPFQETISDPAIEIDGDIALVWAPFVVRVGGKVRNCGIDHFDLVRENASWKVMNLTFSSKVAGCPAQ